MGKAKSSSNDLVERARRSLTRLTRFTNRLQRTQLSCGPVTVQQCHTLEALVSGPLPMNRLADEVALHQSTLTRVVEKLEERELVTRRRLADNQRVVEVALTDKGKELYSNLDSASTQMIGTILDMVPAEERDGAVRGLEVLCDLLDPQNAEAKHVIAECCSIDHHGIPAVARTEVAQ